MKNIFKKSNIPFMKEVLHSGNGRDNWNLARTMQDKNGLQHQLPAEISLLMRGAADGDIWSSCELARNYFSYCPDLFLPEALSLWKTAVLADDVGAKWDVENRPIYDRIMNYRSSDGDFYLTTEMKCAMLTEWYLEKLGRSPWDKLTDRERTVRVKELIRAVCPVLQIPDVQAEFIPYLTFGGNIVDGLAGWDNKVTFRAEILPDIERMVEIVFHELGHIVTFEMMRGGANGKRLQELYGITDERMDSWQRNEQGYEVPTSEEDPDTLSYGVYLMWGTFFLPHADGKNL